MVTVLHKEKQAVSKQTTPKFTKQKVAVVLKYYKY